MNTPDDRQYNPRPLKKHQKSMRNRRICKPIPAKRQIKVYKLLLKGPSGLAPLVNKFKKSCTAFYCEIKVGIISLSAGNAGASTIAHSDSRGITCTNHYQPATPEHQP